VPDNKVVKAVPIQAMKGYGGVEVQIHSFITLTLHGSGQFETLTFLFPEKGHGLYTEQ
jgi:hypothetical protein